ncbi:unnamed protein product [Linum trigynum]|uniref:Uncharacterized protein n=1 Tax=Linum trigynum TaxID=586398 RepID=A0AAV2DA84_9ROSI
MLASLQHHLSVPSIVMVAVERRADVTPAFYSGSGIIVGEVLPAVKNEISSPPSSSSSIVLLLSIVVLATAGCHHRCRSFRCSVALHRGTFASCSATMTLSSIARTCPSPDCQ